METFNHLFFGFKGRIGRLSFWVGCIAIMILEIVLAYFLAGVFDIPISDLTNPALTDDQWVAIYDHVAPLSLLVNVIFLWPWIAVIGKRCHDRNKSAWWTLFAFVPVIGNLWSLLELGLVRGTRGSNRFGQEPTAKA